MHRRHVGRARRDVPRAELLGRARRRAHRRRRRVLRRRRPRRRDERRAAAVRAARRARWSTRCACSATSCSPIHDCPVPVVAKVDGLCVGAGLGLALAADLTWCSDRARFSAIFAKRGLSLDFGTSWLLRQRIGVHKAKELAFTAKMLSGARGVRARPRERGRAGRRARRRDARGRRRRSPPGRRSRSSTTKRELDGASTSSLAQALEVEALAQSVNVHTDDLREALVGLRGAPPAELHGPVGRHGDDDRPETGTRSSTTSQRAPRRVARDGRRRAAARSTAAPGKLDARARIDHLLDPGSFQELGTLVGGEDAPADAVVMGSGRIDGRPVMVAAEDFTVKAGTISRRRTRSATASPSSRSPTACRSS